MKRKIKTYKIFFFAGERKIEITVQTVPNMTPAAIIQSLVKKINDNPDIPMVIFAEDDCLCWKPVEIMEGN